ncbi:unnamed protein product [Urochloa humidicola]
MSSSKSRRGGPCHGTAATVINSDPPFIPVDLLIEILAHSDTKTILCGAATCKPIHRAILSPDFHGRLAPPRAGVFDPALYLGFSCFCSCWYDAFCLQHELRPFSFDAEELSLYDPMVTRGCLVVLHQRRHPSAEVRVVNCLTGHVTRVESPSPGTETIALYPRALLAVGDGGRSFRLLVAGKNLATRIFSSEHGGWGDVVHTRLDPPAPKFLRTLPNRLSPPCVIGDTVHWLCKEEGIVALDVSAARATVIPLPPECFSQVVCPKGVDKGLLVPSPDGRLSLLVAEPSVISMWTLSASTASWSRQVVIQRQAIGGEGPEHAVRFVGFGERSGTVMLQIEQAGLVKIDIGSREAQLTGTAFKEIGPTRRQLQLCLLHETDLPTLIESITKVMKRF